MQELGKPQVLKAALTAACFGSLACYPRLRAFHRYPLWYLEAVLFLGSVLLWGFVFAWHTKFTRRPVFQKPDLRMWSLVTVLGVAGAACLRLGFDPALRQTIPDEYPGNLSEWVSRTLFNLAFTQLFLIFAPLAWLVRLSSKLPFAAAATVVFGTLVLWVKERTSTPQLPHGLLLELSLVRLATSIFSIGLYLRGGVGLVWWWTLLLQSRHLWS